MTSVDTRSTDYHVVTIESDGNDSQSEFKITNTDNWSGQDWSRGTSVSAGSLETYYQPNGGNTSFNETDNKFYTLYLKNVTSGNSEGYIFEFNNAPRTITSVSDNSGSVDNWSNKTVTVDLSDSRSSGEVVYLVYTTNNWGASSIATLVDSDQSDPATFTIPGQSAGTNVKYYIVTSGKSGLSSEADVTKAAIKHDDNFGSFYSYTETAPSAPTTQV